MYNIITKPLRELMLTYSRSDPKEQNSVKIENNVSIFIQQKAFCKRVSPNRE